MNKSDLFLSSAKCAARQHFDETSSFKVSKNFGSTPISLQTRGPMIDENLILSRFRSIGWIHIHHYAERREGASPTLKNEKRAKPPGLPPPLQPSAQIFPATFLRKQGIDEVKAKKMH